MGHWDLPALTHILPALPALLSSLTAFVSEGNSGPLFSLNSELCVLHASISSAGLAGQPDLEVEQPWIPGLGGQAFHWHALNTP